MQRLYFRVIVGLLVILIVSFFVPRFIFEKRRGQGPSPAAEAERHSVQTLRTRLDSVPAERLEQELQQMGKLVDYPLRITDSSDTSIPPGELARAFGMPRGPRSEGPMAGGPRPDVGGPRSNEGRPRMMYVPLKNSQKILVLGPFQDFPHLDFGDLVLPLSIVLAAVLIVGFLVAAPVVRNLRRLETAAARFGEGDFDSRATVRSFDAVGSLATNFNRMADSLQKMIQRERQLLQSVSHELRTPIARIRFGLDMLTSAASPEERAERARQIDEEITEIDQLVGELVDYNRFQSDQVTLDRQPMPLAPLLAEIEHRLAEFRPEIAITATVAPDVTVTADRILFRRAMQNLVMNGIRFAKTKVVIVVRRENEATVIDVGDDGPGVAAEQRDLIMKPFYRAPAAGSEGQSGVGLGLAIVSRIVELHRGRIEVGDSELGGARFTTIWPNA
jgi:two-component system, OmpR family, sensor histidine kinase RstB